MLEPLTTVQKWGPTQCVLVASVRLCSDSTHARLHRHWLHEPRETPNPSVYAGSLQNWWDSGALWEWNWAMWKRQRNSQGLGNGASMLLGTVYHLQSMIDLLFGCCFSLCHWSHAGKLTCCSWASPRIPGTLALPLGTFCLPVPFSLGWLLSQSHRVEGYYFVLSRSNLFLTWGHGIV